MGAFIGVTEESVGPMLRHKFLPKYFYECTESIRHKGRDEEEKNT
jgi:hypothetical protein